MRKGFKGKSDHIYILLEFYLDNNLSNLNMKKEDFFLFYSDLFLCLNKLFLPMYLPKLLVASYQNASFFKSKIFVVLINTKNMLFRI
jgi:hypothetical protein